MNKQSYIFICTFLLGMCFTIIQYFPSIKEKGHHHKTELLKKMPSEDTSGDTCDFEDDGCDDNTEADLFFSNHLKTKSLKSNTYSHNYSSSFYYETQLISIPSPPPKV